MEGTPRSRIRAREHHRKARCGVLVILSKALATAAIDLLQSADECREEVEKHHEVGLLLRLVEELIELSVDDDRLDRRDRLLTETKLPVGTRLAELSKDLLGHPPALTPREERIVLLGLLPEEEPLEATPVLQEPRECADVRLLWIPAADGCSERRARRLGLSHELICSYRMRGGGLRIGRIHGLSIDDTIHMSASK